jgi:hypothetical protein
MYQARHIGHIERIRSLMAEKQYHFKLIHVTLKVAEGIIIISTTLLQ